jgi:lipoate-protein ligase A
VDALAGAARVNADADGDLSWSVQHHVGAAGAFHAWDPVPPARREVRAFAVDRPALVLGSTQPEPDVDLTVARRLGIDVVRRRSGGGAVLLEPGAVAWVDVVVPRGDPLWHDDVGRAFGWLGRAWAAALADLGGPSASTTVHEGGLVRSPLSPVVCFAGLGPGEVLVDGAKVVGISQRRTRDLARLQSSALLHWDADRHAQLLAPGIRRVLGRPADGTPGHDVEVDVTAAVRALAVRALDLPAAEVVEALLARLP